MAIIERLGTAAGEALTFTSQSGEIQPKNFIISGGIIYDRYSAFLQMFRKVFGRVPVIVLHGKNDAFKRAIYEELNNIAASKGGQEHLRIVCNKERGYGYLSSVSEQAVVNTIHQLAVNMGYDSPPQLDRATKTMIKLTEQVNLPKELAGYARLVEPSYAEFRQRISSRISGERANQVANEMEISGRPECFYILQSVIQSLFFEAERNGASYSNNTSIIETVKDCGALFLELNNAMNEQVSVCLSNEIKEIGGNYFVLVIDGVSLADKNLSNLLLNNWGFKWGLMSDDVYSNFGDESSFHSIAEKTDTIMLFKHRTGSIASKYSELIGCADVELEEKSEGTARETFRVIPGSTHKDVRYSLENRFRIMPEEIMNLKSGTAILFNPLTNGISKIN